MPDTTRKNAKHKLSDLVVRFFSSDHISFSQIKFFLESVLVSTIVLDKNYLSKVIYIVADLFDKNANEILDRSIVASAHGRQFVSFERKHYKSPALGPDVPVYIKAASK